MCFSAAASFAGSAVVSAVGIVTVRKAKKPNQRLFAAIPLLFGLQQLVEGMLWVTLTSGEHDWLQNIAAYTFFMIALVIWPVVVPLSMWFMEEVEKRKRILAGLIVIGGIVSLFSAFSLISDDVTPQINGHLIQYVHELPQTPGNIGFILYLSSTIAPLFVSSVRRMRLFAILITLSLLIAAIFFSQHLTSVWCFFAALTSVVIYYVLHGLQATEPSKG